MSVVRVAIPMLRGKRRFHIDKALSWVPEVMRFAPAVSEAGEPEIDATDAEPGFDNENQSPRELAA